VILDSPESAPAKRRNPSGAGLRARAKQAGLHAGRRAADVTEQSRSHSSGSKLACRLDEMGAPASSKRRPPTASGAGPASAQIARRQQRQSSARTNANNKRQSDESIGDGRARPPVSPLGGGHQPNGSIFEQVGPADSQRADELTTRGGRRRRCRHVSAQADRGRLACA
jgi:hypothetical protein